jgi:fermentation-respiration switch protein FrsA (DUF1100 family)
LRNLSLVKGIPLRFRIYILLLLSMGIFSLLGGHNRVIERNFIFFPEKAMVEDPGNLGLDFEDVYFTTIDGVKLHGWFVPGESEVTWLWFHGNAGNISHRLDNLNILQARLGVSVFLFDYRGYGRSEGRVSEKGTYRDAEAALAYLESRPDVDHEKIVFFGRSLGCAVAVDLASRHPPYALILESPFTSISDMAKRVVPLLPIGTLLRTKYNSLSKISGISAPLLVLHGDRDEVVPIESGQQLYQAANEPKKFYTIPDAGHNDTYIVGGEEYFAALRQFLAGLVEKASQ